MGQQRTDFVEILKPIGIIAGIIAVIVIFVMANASERSREPWWEKGKIDRLSVTRCSSKNDTSCKATSENTNVREVLYNGIVYTRYDNKEEQSNLAPLAKRGIGWINLTSLNAWRKQFGNKELTSKDIEDGYNGNGGIYGFQIILSSDRKNLIETYGYCHNENQKQECIVYSATEQYRIRP